jgi:hypothetical protein
MFRHTLLCPTSAPKERVLAQPILTRLIPRHPFLLTLRQVVKVPRHEADNAEGCHDQEYKKCNSERSKAGAPWAACAECVVVVMVDFDGAVAAGVGRRRGFDDGSFAGLPSVSISSWRAALECSMTRTDMARFGLRWRGCHGGVIVIAPRVGSELASHVST